MSEIANWQNAGSPTAPTTNGSNLTINAGVDWVGSAKGRPVVPSEDPTVVFTPVNGGSTVFGAWGFSYSTSAEYSTILPFCWSRKVGETFKVRENNVVKYDSGSTDTSKTFAIEITAAGAVKYYYNNILVYTSASTIASGIYLKATGGFYTFDPTLTTGSTNYQAALTSALVTFGVNIGASADEVDTLLTTFLDGTHNQYAAQDRPPADDADTTIISDPLPRLTEGQAFPTGMSGVEN